MQAALDGCGARGPFASVAWGGPEPDDGHWLDLDAFASEARAIHEGRSEERGIYGHATPAEVRALKEDGVPCAPLPPAPIDPKKAN